MEFSFSPSRRAVVRIDGMQEAAPVRVQRPAHCLTRRGPVGADLDHVLGPQIAHQRIQQRLGVGGYQRGSIWAAADHGVSLFHSEADSDPPRTFITPMSERSGRKLKPEP